MLEQLLPRQKKAGIMNFSCRRPGFSNRPPADIINQLVDSGWLTEARTAANVHHNTHTGSRF